jgi:release factor glutamine methyltransferase
LAISVRQLLNDCCLPRLEAWSLWVAASGQSKAYWIAHDDLPAPLPAHALFARWVEKRQQGWPLAYLVGWREFFGRPFWVNRHTLIPRSDTELLIDTAIALLNRPNDQQGQQKDQGVVRHGPIKVCDLGTGSGCIAVTLALECPGIEVTATDISRSAIQIARNNAARLGASDRVKFAQGSWFEALPADNTSTENANDRLRFDAIVSNPPYIAPQDPHLSQGDLPFEPISALSPEPADLSQTAYRPNPNLNLNPNLNPNPNPVALPKSESTQGLAAIDCIVNQAVGHLNPGGFLLIEHGYDQQSAVIDRFLQAGLVRVKPLQDLAGLPRAVLGFAV